MLAREVALGVHYDLVVTARLDVLFTRPVRADFYHTVLDARSQSSRGHSVVMRGQLNQEPQSAASVAETEDTGRAGRRAPAGRAATERKLIMVANWQSWDGVNDRFMLGHRDAVLKVMQRFDRAAAYCEVRTVKLIVSLVVHQRPRDIYLSISQIVSPLVI